MSPHSPPETVLLAKGTNPDNGGAEMVCYELPSGGKTFAVGSITWVPSLLVDAGTSRITSNVLHRFLETRESPDRSQAPVAGSQV